MAKRDLTSLPKLEGWLTFPDAAKELGISRQRFHQLAEKNDPPLITTARRLGEHTPLYIVRAAEVAQLKAARTGNPALLDPGEPSS